LASIIQVPGDEKDTAPLAIEHVPDVEEASIVNVTPSPEVAVAVGVYEAPPAVASEGTEDVKLTVCDSFPTVTTCCTSDAAK
jgi:hypothetical protein